jgi:hypothetical protein
MSDQEAKGFMPYIPEDEALLPSRKEEASVRRRYPHIDHIELKLMVRLERVEKQLEQISQKLNDLLTR